MAERSSHHVSSVSVLINGAALKPEYAAELLDVKVRSSVSVPSSALVRINDPDPLNRAIVDDDLFKVGNPIEIKTGGMAESSRKSIFKGEIVTFEPEWNKDGCSVAIRAYDKSHRLQRGARARSWKDVTATDIVKSIAADAGLSGSASNTGIKYPFFLQSGETDRQLIRRFEREYNYRFYVEADSYKFVPADQVSDSGVELKYGDTMITFRPRVTGAQQVNSVNVRGWNPEQNQAINGSASNGATVSRPGVARSAVVNALGTHNVLVADRAVETTEEANKIAKASLERRAEAFVEAEGSCYGNPALKAGTTVKISGVGSKLSGTYVLSSVTHSYRGEKGYYTNFEISGASPRGLLDLVHPPEKRDWTSHLVVGVVTNVNDDKKLGRVKVKYPSLAHEGTEMESLWARVVTLAASSQRGMLMLPEVGDEVVVAFENGDARRALVLGAVFNGQRKPGDDLLQTNDGSLAVVSNKKAFFKTKEDMTVKSDKKMIMQITGDREEKTDATLKSEAAQNIEMKAGSSYTIKANSSVKIEAPSIDIKATGSLKLSGATVEVSAQGQAKVTGAQVEVQGSAMTNIKGGIVNLG